MFYAIFQNIIMKEKEGVVLFHDAIMMLFTLTFTFIFIFHLLLRHHHHRFHVSFLTIFPSRRAPAFARHVLPARALFAMLFIITRYLLFIFILPSPSLPPPSQRLPFISFHFSSRFYAERFCFSSFTTRHLNVLRVVEIKRCAAIVTFNACPTRERLFCLLFLPSIFPLPSSLPSLHKMEISQNSMKTYTIFVFHYSSLIYICYACSREDAQQRQVGGEKERFFALWGAL